jgi:uncharacterized protein (DUF362 family)
MGKKDKEKFDAVNSSRRDFIKKAGTAVAGFLAVPYLGPSGIFAYEHKQSSSYLAKVAITNTLNTPADSYIYDDVSGGIKQKVTYLFEQLGGITDIFSSGKKVVIKINLTGGAANSTNAKLNGVPVEEAMWTHPTVIRAVIEEIIGTGVSPNDIIIVESLAASDSFDDSVFQDYMSIKNDLGCQLVNITEGTFVDVSTGSNYFNFSALNMNQVVRDTDVYVSIGKLKQHAEAGITCSIKNQIGSVPQSYYTTQAIQYRRQAIHSPTNESSATFLPRSVCDLFAARPVHLAIIDGIKNATGGEGVWNPNFAPYESHVLFAGKEPVATDSVGAYLMGLDCEAQKLQLPAENSYGDTECDNYLDLLHSKGIGTNKLSEIEVVGDGANLVATDVQPNLKRQIPANFKLCANYPNPFNPSTMIVFYLPKSERVTLKVYDIVGREVETLIQGEVPSGEHRLQWSAQGLASGVYLCRLEADRFSETIKMIYQK